MVWKNAWRGLRQKVGFLTVVAILLTSALFLWLLSFALADTLMASVDEKHVTVATPAFSSDSADVESIIDHIVNTSAYVIGADRRVTLKGYSDVLAPWCTAEDQTGLTDMNICVFAVTLRTAETSFQNVIGKRFIHDYDFQITQILAMHDVYRDIAVGDTLWVQTIHDIEQEAWAQVGKTYLIWGRLQQADRNGETVNRLELSNVGRKKLIEDHGIHLVYAQNSGEAVPTVSEVAGSLDAFWSTETGLAWQRLVLPAAEILYHSVDLVGTDILDSIRAFNREETVIAAGEMLTEEMCRRGERVCLISQELAQQNGWSVGDFIPLGIYDSTRFPTGYHAATGFFFEAEYRIVGIYCNTENEGGVYPNTVYVPIRSIEHLSANRTDFSLVLKSGCENAFEGEMQGMGYGGLFRYDSGPEAENIMEREALDAAKTAWIARVEKLAFRLRMSAVILMALSCLAIMWHAKREIGMFYTIESAEKLLFGHIWIQIAVMGVVSDMLSAILSKWLLSPVTARVLRVPAEAEFADRLMAEIVLPPFDFLSLLPRLGVIWLFGVVAAWIGTKRSYHYTYKEGGRESCY